MCSSASFALQDQRVRLRDYQIRRHRSTPLRDQRAHGRREALVIRVGRDEERVPRTRIDEVLSGHGDAS
jgi:hypothetical protein